MTLDNIILPSTSVSILLFLQIINFYCSISFLCNKHISVALRNYAMADISHNTSTGIVICRSFCVAPKSLCSYLSYCHEK